MKQIKLINLENVSDEEADKYPIREAARAIVFDENNFIALLHATKTHYYKLPGGGIEKGETKEEALKRECLEEIGCNIKIVKELGLTVEYRKEFNVKQISYCYIARLIGKKGLPDLEQDEEDEGFQTIWISLEDAIEKVHESRPTVYDGPYIIARDFELLKATKEILKEIPL